MGQPRKISIKARLKPAKDWSQVFLAPALDFSVYPSRPDTPIISLPAKPKTMHAGIESSRRCALSCGPEGQIFSAFYLVACAAALNPSRPAAWPNRPRGVYILGAASRLGEGIRRRRRRIGVQKSHALYRECKSYALYRKGCCRQLFLGVFEPLGSPGCRHGAREPSQPAWLGSRSRRVVADREPQDHPTHSRVRAVRSNWLATRSVAIRIDCSVLVGVDLAFLGDFTPVLAKHTPSPWPVHSAIGRQIGLVVAGTIPIQIGARE